MDLNFSQLNKQMSEMLQEAQQHLTSEQRVEISKFQNQFKGVFKDVDLNDIEKIDMNVLNERLDKLKNIANGFSSIK